MKKPNGYSFFPVLFLTLVIILLSSGPVLATDDGPRAYWKGREGTQMFAFSYLRWDINAAGSQQFDPAHYIYPNSDIEASVFLGMWGRHFTVFNRPSTLSVALAGGNVDVNVDTNIAPPEFLPPGVIRVAPSASRPPDTRTPTCRSWSIFLEPRSSRAMSIC